MVRVISMMRGSKVGAAIVGIGMVSLAAAVLVVRCSRRKSRGSNACRNNGMFLTGQREIDRRREHALELEPNRTR